MYLQIYIYIYVPKRSSYSAILSFFFWGECRRGGVLTRTVLGLSNCVSGVLVNHACLRVSTLARLGSEPTLFWTRPSRAPSSKKNRAPFPNKVGLHFHIEPGSISKWSRDSFPNGAGLHVRASFPNGVGLHFQMEPGSIFKKSRGPCPGFISKWSQAPFQIKPISIFNYSRTSFRKGAGIWSPDWPLQGATPHPKGNRFLYHWAARAWGLSLLSCWQQAITLLPFRTLVQQLSK